MQAKNEEKLENPHQNLHCGMRDFDLTAKISENGMGILKFLGSDTVNEGSDSEWRD